MGHYCIDLIDKQWQVIFFFLDNKERKRKLNLSGASINGQGELSREAQLDVYGKVIPLRVLR